MTLHYITSHHTSPHHTITPHSKEQQINHIHTIPGPFDSTPPSAFVVGYLNKHTRKYSKESSVNVASSRIILWEERIGFLSNSKYIDCPWERTQLYAGWCKIHKRAFTGRRETLDSYSLELFLRRVIRSLLYPKTFRRVFVSFIAPEVCISEWWLLCIRISVLFGFVWHIRRSFFSHPPPKGLRIHAVEEG
jgi:hypothetical protein